MLDEFTPITFVKDCENGNLRLVWKGFVFVAGAKLVLWTLPCKYIDGVEVEEEEGGCEGGA